MSESTPRHAVTNNQTSQGENTIISDIDVEALLVFPVPTPYPSSASGYPGQIVDHLLGTTEQSMMSEGNSDCKILANQAGRLSVV